MHSIDLNCDMGEGIGHDAGIMPFISSTNIACGYHAGNEQTIWDTAQLALQYQVAIGAHVSLLDRDNFGRTEQPVSAEEVYDLVTQQLFLMQEIINPLHAVIRHIKPHGALYNMAAREPSLALAIARAARDADPSIVLYGLSGSHSIKAAAAAGLRTASEVFADRTYQDDGSLTPRSQPGALIENVDEAVNQVLQMIEQGTVHTRAGKTIAIRAETICLHGDGKHAVSFASHIHQALKQKGIDIKAI